MKRLNFEEKLKEVKMMSKKGRPIANLAKPVRNNHSLDYDSDSLRARSKKIAATRATRYNRVATKF